MLADVFSAAFFALAYTVVGLGLLLIGFLVIDWLTPGNLRKEIFEHDQRGAAIVTAAGEFSIGLIAFSTIWNNATSGFGSALTYTIVFGLLGIALQAVSFLVLGLLTPGKIGDLIHDRELSTGATRIKAGVFVLASYQIAIAGVVVASIS